MKIEKAESLLKITFSDGVIGFTDLVVWEQLGDPSYKETCDSFFSEPNCLAKAALECARIDGEARANKTSLFENLKIPQSHYFYREGDSIEEIIEAGYRTVKIKVSPESSLNKFKGAPLKIRLDANNKFSKTSFEAWFDKELIPQIDFIEDPYPMDLSWNLSAVPFAADRQESDQGAAVSIFKPALKGLNYTGSLPVVVTGYLGHPFGDAFAAYVAGKILEQDKRVLTCGLQSCSKQTSPNFTPEKGYGFGFDSYLESLSWSTF